MKIISISGLDGSGKSTQIQLLKQLLESQGKRVFYFHAIQFGIANKIKNFPSSKPTLNGRPSEYGTKSFYKKSVTEASCFQIWLRKIFLGIDICRFSKLVEKLKKEGYDYILTDRYFYDSLVNIEYLQKSTVTFKNKITKPDIAIYLKTDPKQIMQRERKPDQGMEYLKKKKEIFDKYAKEWNLKIINGNRTKEEVFEEIKNLLN